MIFTPTKTFADAGMQRTNLWVADMMGASYDQAQALSRSPEAIVAQAALESAWGRAAIGFNIFGIKADPSWKGPVLMRRTAEENADGSVYYVTAAFRDYPSFKASVEDHFAFLKANANYAAAGVFDAKSDREYFEALKRAGYATDVTYADKLMAMVASVQIFSSSMHMSLTAEAIATAPPPPRLLLVGLQGPDVSALQSALAGRHFYFGRIDGDFGPATRDAVRAFQRSAGLVEDGMAGTLTRTALGS